MKWILLGLLITTSLFAENSKIIPVFLEASEHYIAHAGKVQGNDYLRPDVRAAVMVLEKHSVDPVMLGSVLTIKKTANWPLRADDLYDHWARNPQKMDPTVPEVALHAFKFDVLEASDDWFKDDIYAYYFITDGVIPTGKVTSIYKGLSSGQSFFFNDVDRAIFPLAELGAKRPNGHLIVDYGIIESDGDDIKKIQKLSSVIIDLAIAVYTSIDPEHGQILINLRKEIKALAESLLSMNNDDRMAIGSFGLRAQEIKEMLRENTYVELSKKHGDNATLDTWKYQLHFRLLRN